MASFNEIVTYFNAVDNTSNVAQNVGQNVQQLQGNMQGMSNETGGLMNNVRKLSTVFSGLNGMMMGFFGMYGLTNFKQMTYGYATAREELLSLHKSAYGTTEASTKMWEKMDELTNQGYVQLDDLTQVMSNFKMSTGASTEQADKMAETANKVGNIAILMGKDAYSTMALMQSAVGGVNGQLNMMRIHLGVTKDKLTSLGWSGEATDIDGYTQALERYLETINTQDLLGSTEGKVISLQKRFRIAGRNIGNFFLPYINAVLDAFTKLNSGSDDMLAKMVILSTGFMSGFASILPTLSPLIQTYDFFIKQPKIKKAQEIAEFEKLCGSAQQSSVCIAGATSRMGLFRKSIDSVKTYIKGNASFLNPLNYNLIRNNDLINKSISKLREFLKLYMTEGQLEKFDLFTHTKDLSFDDKIKQHKSSVGKSNKTEGLYDATEIALINRRTKAKEREILVENQSTNSILRNTLARKGGIVQKIRSIFFSEANAVANVEEAVSEDLDTVSTEANTFAQLKNALATEGGIVVKLKAIGIWIRDTAVKIANFVWTNALTIAQWLLNTPVLLLVGILVSLFVILDRIGKNLGWWDNWGEMISAVWSGIQRLWSAFINNPNVQATIQMIQGAFSGLGDIIGDVAWAIMQLFGWKDDGSEFDFVRAIIDTFGALGRILGDIVNVFKFVFSAIYTVTAPIVGAIVWVLRSIICILIGCSPGIIPALNMVSYTFRKIFGELANWVNNPIGTIVRVLQLWQGMLFKIAKGIGQSIWNGLNSVLGGIPQKVWNIFWNMVNNLAQIPQQAFNTAQKIGQDIYSGIDSGVSYWTGGLVHLPSMGGNAQTNAKTVGNVNKNYNNVKQGNKGHVFNIQEGAIKLDARNLTTKESKQVMINALEGLTTYETVHTKKATR